MTIPSSYFFLLAKAFWIPLVVGLVIAKPMLALLIRLKSRQTISQYAPEGHQAKQGTPTMGGLIIVIALLIGLVLNYFLLNASTAYDACWLVAGFALIGFIDDFIVPRYMKGKRGLGWKQKILMQLAVAIAACWGYGSPALVAIGVFVVLFYSNAFNFADGLDGLAGSLGVVIFATLGGLCLFRLTADPFPCVAAVGAILPFLFLNAPPARVFMGDVGSLPLGALMGSIVMHLIFPRTGGFTAWVGPDLFIGGAVACKVLSIVIIAELVPVPLQIFWVKVFKKKLFPYTPIHHAFEKAGWPESRVVWMFVLVQVLCAAGALTIAAAYPPSDRDFKGSSGLSRVAVTQSQMGRMGPMGRMGQEATPQ